MAENGKYVVLAPLIQLKYKDQAGAWVFRQFMAGAVLDRDEVEFDEENFQSHLDSGQVVEAGSDVAVVFAVSAGTPLPGRPPNVEVTEAGNTGQPLPPLSADLLRAAEIDATGEEEWAAESTDRESAPVGAKPDGRASEARWREYHVRQLMAAGESAEDANREAEGMSKAELVAQYK